MKDWHVKSILLITIVLASCSSNDDGNMTDPDSNNLDVNMNGIVDAYDTSITGGPDADGDGIEDFADVDVQGGEDRDGDNVVDTVFSDDISTTPDSIIQILPASDDLETLCQLIYDEPLVGPLQLNVDFRNRGNKSNYSFSVDPNEAVLTLEEDENAPLRQTAMMPELIPGEVGEVSFEIPLTRCYGVCKFTLEWPSPNFGSSQHKNMDEASCTNVDVL